METYNKISTEDLTTDIIPLDPGVYSVLLIGGGGGGCGVPYGGGNEHLVSAAGGGSGYAWKGRVEIFEYDVVRVVVGQGGGAGQRSGGQGGITTLYVNDEVVDFASGGQGGRFVGEAMSGSHYTDTFAIGGEGASGGGSSDGDLIRNSNQEWRMRQAGNGGENGSNGGAVTLGELTLFEGGSGAGEHYYDRINFQIDPDVKHLFNCCSIGFGGSAQNFDTVPTWTSVYNVAGGGAGYGTTYLGDIHDSVYSTGHGFGAGGGGGCPGIRGVASFIKVAENETRGVITYA